MRNEIADRIFSYLTKGEGDVAPLDREQYVTKGESQDGFGLSLNTYLEGVVELANRSDSASNESVEYEVLYGFEVGGKEATLIITMKDTYAVEYDDLHESYVEELVHRGVESAVLSYDGAEHDLDLEEYKREIAEYEPLHDKVYDAFRTSRWSSLFKWDGLDEYKRQRRRMWKRNAPIKGRGGSAGEFEAFQNTALEGLRGRLEEGVDREELITYVGQMLDTAHLYGLKEGQKIKNR